MDYILFDRQFEEPTIPYDVLSASFSRMKKSYNVPEIYAKGLVYTVDNFVKFLLAYRLRVYYDESVEKNAAFSRALNQAREDERVGSAREIQAPVARGK
jgi:hypothetical protein